MADESGAELETELLARARQTADEYMQDARATAQRIGDDADERIRLREEHEAQLAKTAGDRVCRQRVQAATLGFTAELERLRWTLIQEVLGELARRLARFAEDESAYPSLLGARLASAARSIGRQDLVVEMNARDRRRFDRKFDELAQAAAPEAHIELGREPIDCLGGLVVQSTDERARVDDTFDARIRRSERRLEEVIMGELFGSFGERSTSLG